MFNLFKSDKEKIKEAHIAYKSKEIEYSEYADSFYRALCNSLLSKEAKKILSELDIDIYKGDKINDTKCKVDKLRLLASEGKYLSSVMSQVQKLVRERGERKNPDVLKFGHRYAGVPIVSYDEIMEIAKNTERQEDYQTIKDKETLHCLIDVSFSTSKLSFYAAMLTYSGMVTADAIIE